MPHGTHDPGLNWRADAVNLALIDLEKDVTFQAPLANNLYSLQLTANKLTTALWWSNKTPEGFKLHLGVGINGQVDYLAIPYN